MESVIKTLAKVGNFMYPNGTVAILNESIGIEKGNTILHPINEIMRTEELEETEEESTEEEEAASCCVRHSLNYEAGILWYHFAISRPMAWGLSSCK